ncbi:MAG: aminoglycoside phosphotransferase family protein [Planctomycetota bacterium]|nr:aminoglycoside phosphotransferase family protein [Planctomycetota bacterium]
MTRLHGASSAPDHPDNDDLRTFVEETLGTGLQFEDVSRDVGRLSTVWAVISSDGTRHFVKQHEERKLFEREDRAYARWVPHLRSVQQVHVAEVVGRSDALGALVLTSVPEGTLVVELTDERAQATAYRRAGRFLRALHDLPLDERVPDPVQHMRSIIERYVIDHAQAFDRDTIDWALDALDDGRPFEGAPFVCAHRDFSPRNWVLAPDGSLGLFDWERAQGDLWFADVTRMEFDVWPAQPALRDAFFAGYGHPLTERDRRQVRLATLIHAIASAGWAAGRSDTRFEQLGRTVVARLRAES